MQTNFLLNIPAMKVPGAECAKTLRCGEGSLVTTIPNTTKADYDAYLNLLEQYGFVKYVDNGDGIDHSVYCATYTRDNIVLTIGYYSGHKKTSICLAFDMPLSKNLFYDESYVKDNKPEAKTKLHMKELWLFGNSFIFQLKNNHFIISDGGTWRDTPYLLDYLESLVPEGEIPVVDAWVISHGHMDHIGCLNEIWEHKEWIERIRVEGIYFSAPDEKVTWREVDVRIGIARNKALATRLLTSAGEHPQIYRLQTGQRYYFNDITMEVLFSQEQLPADEYDAIGNVNDSSSICLFTVEGQKIFISGDAHNGALGFVKDNYSKEFLDLDMFTLNHHGFNTWQEFNEYIDLKTLLLPVSMDDLPVRKFRENEFIKRKAKEYFNYADGTKIMTFPYEVGTYECVPTEVWRYHEEPERPVWDCVYTYGGRILESFIFNIDEIIFDGFEVRDGVVELLEKLKKSEVRITGVSKKLTKQVKTELSQYQLEEYFEYIVGAEMVAEMNPAPDAYLKVTEYINLEDVHRYLIIARNIDDVLAANRSGLRVIVLADEAEVDDNLEVRSWKIVKSLEEILPFLTSRKVKLCPE